MNVSVCSVEPVWGLKVSPWLSAFDFYFFFFFSFFLALLFHCPELGTVDMSCLIVRNMNKAAI